MHTRSRILIVMFLVLIGSLLLPLTASAQEGGDLLPVRLRKDFGFNAGVRIQGRFTLLVQGDGEYSLVDFFIDDELVYTDHEAPFEYTFHTDAIGLGAHSVQAVASTADGSRISSAVIAREVVSAEEGWEVAAKIALPIIGISLLISVFGAAGPMILVRDKKRFEPGKYGAMGGTICRRCGMPFARPFLAPNLLVGKLVRCPHCGKVAVLPAASREALLQAEERYRIENEEGAASPETMEDTLHQQIEDSRFME